MKKKYYLIFCFNGELGKLQEIKLSLFCSSEVSSIQLGHSTTLLCLPRYISHQLKQFSLGGWLIHVSLIWIIQNFQFFQHFRRWRFCLPNFSRIKNVLAKGIFCSNLGPALGREWGGVHVLGVGRGWVSIVSFGVFHAFVFVAFWMLKFQHFIKCLSSSFQVVLPFHVAWNNLK